MNASVLLHPAQALLIAADAAPELFCTALLYFIRPFRVRNELATHRHEVDAPLGHLLLNKIRVGQAAHAADEQGRIMGTWSQ